MEHAVRPRVTLNSRNKVDGAQCERTYLLFEDFGSRVTQRHLGPASGAIVVHLDGDDRVERRLSGSHFHRQ